MSVRIRSKVAVTTVLAVAVASLLAVSAPLARAASAPGRGSFSTYTGSTPLAQVPPGTVLKTRSLYYHVAGVAVPVHVIQLVYRSAGALGQPATNVTSVLEPPVSLGSPRAVSYQSFYDSLNPADEPSVQIAGGLSLGGFIADAESVVIAPLLLQGYTVIVPDTEGQTADFAAGTEYGINTLNSIRAATSSPLTGLDTSTPIGMIGYSGGAIATDWAAQLAPSYAPDVNRQLVGAAEGGILVDPAHNLTYVNGSLVWAGVIPMSIIGIARGFHIDITPYLSSYGLQLYSKLQKASISNVLGQYPGLTYAQLVKPRYANPASIPVLVKVENELNTGSARVAFHSHVHGPGGQRNPRRHSRQQARHRSRRRSDGRRRCPHPGSRLLCLRHGGGLHPVRRPEPRDNLPRLGTGCPGLARQPLCREPGTE